MNSTSAVAQINHAVSPLLIAGAGGSPDWAPENNGNSSKPSAAGTRLKETRIFPSPRRAAGSAALARGGHCCQTVPAIYSTRQLRLDRPSLGVENSSCSTQPGMRDYSAELSV